MVVEEGEEGDCHCEDEEGEGVADLCGNEGWDAGTVLACWFNSNSETWTCEFWILGKAGFELLDFVAIMSLGGKKRSEINSILFF